jgi:PAS domain S-box-containing protein
MNRTELTRAPNPHRASGAEPAAPQIAARLSWICRVAGVSAAALGTVVLSGWLLDIASLKSIVTGWPTMKANAALACILAGLSLWGLSYEPARRGLRATVLVGSFAIMAISLLTLSQDIFGWDLGIDGLLVLESRGAIETTVPGRMPPSTALTFFLIGVAVQFLTVNSRGRKRAAEYLAVVVLALSGLVLLGHLYGVHVLHQFGTYGSMALPTSIAFIMLSIGVLAAAGPGGWMTVAVSSSNSGHMLRSLWIPSICILPVLGAFRLLGERLGFYGTEFGLALMITLAIFVLTVLAWRYARSVERTDAARRRTEAELRTNEERLRLAMASAGMSTWDADPHTGESVWSENRFELFGYPPAVGGRATREMWRNRVHPDDLGKVMRALEEARRERSLYASDHRIVRADDGRIVWVRVAGRFSYDDAGEAIRFSGVSFDDTPRKRAELALRESEHRERERAAELEALLEAVPAAVLIAQDPDGYRIRRNRAANALFRLEAGQEASLSAPGPERPTHFKLLKDGRELAGEELPVQRAARGFAMDDFEMSVVFSDGTTRHLLGNAVPLRDERGEPRGAVAAFVDITERKRAEEALRVSEARFRSYFELGLIGMTITSPTQGILEVNDELCNILGFDRSELLQTTWAQLTYPEDRASDVAEFNRVLAGEIDGYILDKRWIRKDGEVIFTTISVRCLRRADGTVDYFVALLQDITERKRAEEALRESEKQLSYALEASTEGLWDWNVQTGTVHYSPNWIKALGYSLEEVPSHVSFWQGIIHPKDVQSVRDALAAHFEGRTPLYACESRLRLKSGEYRWNLDRGKVVEWDADGTPLRMVGTDADITERKEAELAQGQLAAIVESNGDAIISRGLDRTILSWNPAAERLFGWTAQEAIGRSMRITTPPEAWGTRDALIERVKRGEMVGSIETVRVRKDGTRFHGEVSYSPVKDAQGKVVSIATVIRDITERKQAEQALRDYTERLESVSRELLEVREKERAAIVRELHDQIGQLLGAAKLGLQVMRRRGTEAPPHGDLDESIRTIDQALEETRTLSADPRPPQLDELGLPAALRLYAERLARASRLKLHFAPTRLPALRPQLDATCFRVAQEALQNIVRHASAKNIWIELSAEGGVLHLTVRDDGMGCDLAAVRSRAKRGDSRGLLNMEECVALAGGTIEFESGAGNGLKVHADFPLTETPVSAPDESSSGAI